MLEMVNRPLVLLGDGAIAEAAWPPCRTTPAFVKLRLVRLELIYRVSPRTG